MNQWRVDEAWTDGVDPYQVLGMVDGIAAGEANYGGFGRAIRGCSELVVILLYTRRGGEATIVQKVTRKGMG